MLDFVHVIHVFDSTKIGSQLVTKALYSVHTYIYIHVPGPVLLLPLAAAATSTGRELAPSMPSCTLLDTLPTLVLRSKLLFLESRGDSCTPCSEYSSDLSR